MAEQVTIAETQDLLKEFKILLFPHHIFNLTYPKKLETTTTFFSNHRLDFEDKGKLPTELLKIASSFSKRFIHKLFQNILLFIYLFFTSTLTGFVEADLLAEGKV